MPPKFFDALNAFFLRENNLYHFIKYYICDTCWTIIKDVEARK